MSQTYISWVYCKGLVQTLNLNEYKSVWLVVDYYTYLYSESNTELVSLYIGYLTLNNYYYYYLLLGEYKNFIITTYQFEWIFMGGWSDAECAY